MISLLLLLTNSPALTRDSSTCDPSSGIDILDSIDETTFTKKYAERRPFLLRGSLSVNWWKKQRDWSLVGLGDFGQSEVSVGCDSLQVTSVTDWSRHRTALETALDLIAFNRTIATFNCTRPTVFDRGLFRLPSLHGILINHLDIQPKWFWAGRERYLEDLDALVMIGANDSGTPFHAHHCAYNLLLSGNKTWFLSAADDPPIDTQQQPMSVWARNTFPSLSAPSQPLSFVQRQGDLVYVPAGYRHATLCSGTNVAVSIQVHPKHYANSPTLTSKAMRSHQRAVELNPTHSSSFHKLGEMHVRSSRWQEAQHCYESHIALRPTHAHAHSDLGLVQMQLKQLPQAAAAFSRAQEIDPGSFVANFGVAETARLRHDFDAAAVNFGKAVSTYDAESNDANDKRAMLQMSYKNLCQLLFVKGRFKEAAKTGKTALKVFPSDEKLTVVWAMAAIKQLAKTKSKKKVRNAQNKVRNALSVHPQSLHLRGLLAEVMRLASEFG